VTGFVGVELPGGVVTGGVVTAGGVVTVGGVVVTWGGVVVVVGGRLVVRVGGRVVRRVDGGWEVGSSEADADTDGDGVGEAETGAVEDTGDVWLTGWPGSSLPPELVSSRPRATATPSTTTVRAASIAFIRVDRPGRPAPSGRSRSPAQPAAAP
jgi:hypothetical protein